MNKKTILSVIALATLAVGARPAFAGFAQENSVTLGGEPVFSISADAEGYTAAHRAWLAQDALDNALVLAHNTSPSAVTVDRLNGALCVMLDGRKVATADAASANMAGLTADQLANKWADSIRSFLSDQGRAVAYIATLKNEHQIKSDVAIIERRLYAPAGTAFTVALNKEISPATCKGGELVEATLSKDIPLGSYVIPEGSVVIGEVVETEPTNYSISFTRLRTPSGTEVPITAFATNDYVIGTQGPHPVCTYAIPSGMANGIPQVAGRIPAGTGIGAVGGASTTTLVFHRGDSVITAGAPMTLVFEKVTPVAVITRDHVM